MSRYLAIDLDPAGLYVVAGTARGGAIKVEQALAWTADADGPPQLTADTARVIGERLRDRLKAAGIAPGPTVVAVGRDKVILKEVRHPKVAPAEEPALVRFQALKEITEAADDVVLDYAPLVNGVPEGEQRSLVVVLRKDVFASIQAMCAAAGLKLAGVSPRPFAIAAGLARALAAGTTPAPGDPTDAVAILTTGPGGGEFAVVREGHVSFTRAVPGPVLANEAMLTSEIRRNLAVYAGQTPGHPVRAVYVAEAGMGGWANRLRTSVGVPVHAYDPLDGAAAEVPANSRGRFAGAAGLLAGRAADALPINFAAPRQPKAEADPKRRLVMLGALALLVLVGGGGFLAWTMLQAADDRLANLEAKKQHFQKEIAGKEAVGKQLDALQQWQSREVVWVDELFDMTDRFPSDGLVLTQLTATPIPPDKTGRQIAQARLELKLMARNSEAVDALVTAIEQDSSGRKYYTDTQKLTQQDVFTVTTRVHRRTPAEYTRVPVFSSPPRKLVIPTAKDKEETPPKGVAPMGEEVINP